MENNIFDDSKYTVTKKPIINCTTELCPECKKELIYTGRVKLLYPPLDIVCCNKCMYIYWKEQL